MGQELAPHSTVLPSAPAGSDRIADIARAIVACRLDVVNMPLVSAEDCRLMIATVEADRASRPSPAEAVEFARDLLGAYGRLDVHDPDRFVQAIAETMTHYPRSIVIAMCHPVTGMPGQQKRAPNAPADIKAWCDGLLTARSEMKWKAEAILKERDKRAREAREFALVSAEKEKTPEERAAIAARVRARASRAVNPVEPLDD